MCTIEFAHMNSVIFFENACIIVFTLRFRYQPIVLYISDIVVMLYINIL